MDQKKYFLTYGDGLFTNQKDRIKQEAEKSCLFDGVYAYSRNDITDFINQHKFIFNHVAAGGFLWKQHVILKLLSQVNDFDIVFYCDAGSCIVNYGEWKSQREERFDFYVSLVNNSILPVATFSPWVIKDGENSRGTRYDLELKIPFYNNRNNFDNYTLEKFGLLNNQHFLDSPAVEAGCIIVRKTPQSIDFIQSWLDLMIENGYDLILNHGITDQKLLNILVYRYYLPRIDGKDFYGEGPFYATRYTDSGQKPGYNLPPI